MESACLLGHPPVQAYPLALVYLSDHPLASVCPWDRRLVSVFRLECQSVPAYRSV